MTAAVRSPRSPDWSDLATLGEQIISAATLTSQREQIISMVSRLVKGDVVVWFQENLFQLPDALNKTVFEQKAPSAGMKRAMKSGEITIKQKRGTKKGSASPGTWAVVPLEEQGITLGAIQINRPKGPAFKKDELNLLEGLAGVYLCQPGCLSSFCSGTLQVESTESCSRS